MTANNPPALAFNSGYAYQIGWRHTNPTPSQIKILQSASLDLKATTKKLFGQNVFPVAVGRSQISADGKLKFADYQPRMIRDFVGAPNNSLMTAGQTLVNVNEAHSVPASSPYTVTVTNSRNVRARLGRYLFHHRHTVDQCSFRPDSVGQSIPTLRASTLLLLLLMRAWRCCFHIPVRFRHRATR